MLSVMIYDKIAWIMWSKTKDGAKNKNIPKPLSVTLFNEDNDSNVKSFSNADEFKKAREKILKGGN